MDISVGFGPILWGVDYGHNVWFKALGPIKQPGQDGWIDVDKPDGANKMVRLDVGRDGHVWGVDDANKVYYRRGISPTVKKGTAWHEIEGSNFVDVAVCTTGHVWGVSADNQVYYRTRIVDDNQEGEAWALTTDSLAENGSGNNYATQVTCAGGKVLILGTNDKIFQRTDVTNDTPQGSGW